MTARDIFGDRSTWTRGRIIYLGVGVVASLVGIVLIGSGLIR